MPGLHSRSRISNIAQRAILAAVYEYLLITLPIALYTGLEAIHARQLIRFFVTPEWAIATVFLVFQAGALRRARFARAHLRPKGTISGIFSLVALMVIVVAAVNAYGDLGHSTRVSVGIRLGLFAVVSFGFVLMVSSAELATFQRRGQNVKRET